MKLTRLTIQNVSTWADVSFEFDDHPPLSLRCSSVYSSCFAYLIVTLLSVSYDQEISWTRFELEEGWIDLVLVMYPEDNLRVEFYKDVDWEKVKDEHSENMPEPMLSFFTDWHAFSFTVSQAFREHNQDSFQSFEFPADELNHLSKRMVGR